MKSPGLHVSSHGSELAVRVAAVLQASRAIRSEVALTICESSEMRVASRQLRMDIRLTTNVIATQLQGLRNKGKARRSQWIAQAIAQVLSTQGYSVFVEAPPTDTASVQ